MGLHSGPLRIRLGVDGVLGKALTERAASAGLVLAREGEAADLVALPSALSLEGSRGGETGARFSRREVEILEYLADGWSNAEIASVLRIGVRTVRFHLEGIYAKLGVVRRGEAVREALRAGLVRFELLSRPPVLQAGPSLRTRLSSFPCARIRSSSPRRRTARGMAPSAGEPPREGLLGARRDRIGLAALRHSGPLSRLARDADRRRLLSGAQSLQCEFLSTRFARSEGHGLPRALDPRSRPPRRRGREEGSRTAEYAASFK